MTPLIVTQHEGVEVVREDLYPGGTKARLFGHLYEQHDAIVYACSAISCTQISLARASAVRQGTKAVVFCGARATRTSQTQAALGYGAELHEVRPGYLSVAKARASEYAKTTGAYVLPLGFDTMDMIDELARIAGTVNPAPDEVWCAAGSGMLTRSLQWAWPNARHHAVQVGGACDVGIATRHVHHSQFDKPSKFICPFPAEPHYEAKAWEVCSKEHGTGRVLFWNMMGPV